MTRLNNNYPAPESWDWAWNRVIWNNDGFPLCALYKDKVRVYFSGSFGPGGFIGEIPLEEALPYLRHGLGNVNDYSDFTVVKTLSDGGYFEFIVSLGETEVGGFLLPDLGKVEKVDKTSPYWPLMVEYSTKSTRQEWEEAVLKSEDLLGRKK